MCLKSKTNGTHFHKLKISIPCFAGFFANTTIEEILRGFTSTGVSLHTARHPMLKVLV